jgi:hypothetical protein
MWCVLEVRSVLNYTFINVTNSLNLLVLTVNISGPNLFFFFYGFNIVPVSLNSNTSSFPRKLYFFTHHSVRDKNTEEFYIKSEHALIKHHIQILRVMQ